MDDLKSNVVDLDRHRNDQRLNVLRQRAESSLEENRQTLIRLYQTGEVLTRVGAAQGQRLLRARERLLRGLALANDLSGDGLIPPPRLDSHREASFSRLEAMLSQ